MRGVRDNNTTKPPPMKVILRTTLRTTVTPAARAEAVKHTEPTPKGMKATVRTKAEEPRAEAGNHSNREAWLVRAVELLQQFARNSSVNLPTVRVSVGWAFGSRGTSERKLSQTWDAKTARDGIAQVFIAPTVDEGGQAILLLAHELCHAFAGAEEGHTGENFREAANALGFAEPLREPNATSLLKGRIEGIIERLGAYPHSALKLAKDGTPQGHKKDGTRQLKCICPKSGYVCRTTRKWLDLHGAPLSPVTKEPMTVCAEGGAE